MKTHKNLLVWQKSISFVTTIYNLTKSFTKEELYSIVSQIRRAAVSIPSNMAEGCARRNIKEYIQFLYISLGSAAELETHLIISSNLGYIEELNKQNLLNELEEIIRMITGLIKALSDRCTDLSLVSCPLSLVPCLFLIPCPYFNTMLFPIKNIVYFEITNILYTFASLF